MRAAGELGLTLIFGVAKPPQLPFPLPTAEFAQLANCDPLAGKWVKLWKQSLQLQV
jgi:hypothetical protein